MPLTDPPADAAPADDPSAAAAGTPAPAAPRLMHVGELAERVQLSHRTVRYYDDEGLLTATARSAGNYRLYTEADVERMLVIRQMKPLGFSLEQMGRVLRLIDAVDAGEASDGAADAADEGGPGDAGDGPGRRGGRGRAGPVGGVGEDADVDVSEYIDQARARRAKLAGQVAAADDFITHLEHVRARITATAPRP